MIVVTLLFVIFKHKIDSKALFTISIIAVAANAITVLFMDSFEKIAGIEGWPFYFYFALMNLIMAVLAYLLFLKNTGTETENKKISRTGWTISIVTAIAPFIYLTIETRALFHNVWDLLNEIWGVISFADLNEGFTMFVFAIVYFYPISLILILFVFYRLTKEYLPAPVKTAFFETGFIIISICIYLINVLYCTIS